MILSRCPRPGRLILSASLLIALRHSTHFPFIFLLLETHPFHSLKMLLPFSPIIPRYFALLKLPPSAPDFVSKWLMEFFKIPLKLIQWFKQCFFSPSKYLISLIFHSPLLFLLLAESFFIFIKCVNFIGNKINFWVSLLL